MSPQHPQSAAPSLLIRQAEVPGRGLVDLRIEAGRIDEIGTALSEADGIPVVEAGGAALLPGLHDHHIHLTSLAAALNSVRCGPPDVNDAQELACVLGAADRAGDASQWIRGIGYHPSVAGEIDRHWLDRQVVSRPIRLQHRSGRLWVLNSRALEVLGPLPDDAPLERVDGQWTGRLYDADAWLRARMTHDWPSLAQVSRELARRGITSVTDATPDNGAHTVDRFRRQQQDGQLLQDVLLMGDESLAACQTDNALRVGPLKLHWHEVQLPEFDEAVGRIRRSHAAGRPVAIHCVTQAELLFALHAVDSAGPLPGDRIEHASVAPEEAVTMARQLGLRIVTQPNFVHERGDAYLRDVELLDQPSLYRLQSWKDAGVPLAAGSDAPFGGFDPWAAMDAAVNRRTAQGTPLGASESLDPQAACALFLGAADDPGGPVRRLEVGAEATLCLLDRDWSAAQSSFRSVDVRLTLLRGRILWQDGVL